MNSGIWIKLTGDIDFLPLFQVSLIINNHVTGNIERCIVECIINIYTVSRKGSFVIGDHSTVHRE